MRNITVSIDEETHRLARIRAAELDTSLSALVRGYLKGLAERHSMEPAPALPSQTGRSRLRKVVEKITAGGGGLRMAENLPREELYDRPRAKAEAKEGASVAIDNENPAPR